MQKYGFENFDFSILETVADKTKLLEREQVWLDELKPFDKSIGYNLNPKAGSWMGMKHSEETKKKLSNIKKGVKSNLSDEGRQRIIEYCREKAIGTIFGKKPVHQIDLVTNKIISTYESLLEASIKTGVDRQLISSAIIKRNYAGGFFWCLVEKYHGQIFSRKRKISFRKVAYFAKVEQRLPDGTTKEWESMAEASKTIGVDIKNIYHACLNGKTFDDNLWSCEIPESFYEKSSI